MVIIVFLRHVNSVDHCVHRCVPVHITHACVCWGVGGGGSFYRLCHSLLTILMDLGHDSVAQCQCSEEVVSVFVPRFNNPQQFCVIKLKRSLCIWVGREVHFGCILPTSIQTKTLNKRQVINATVETTYKHAHCDATQW